ncbi:MAG: formylglycine-generating enzyme family protein, partial [Planctomycetota bacterium]
IVSIRDRAQCPIYGGLEIAPQVGLLPIGRDSGSGLWEFAHLQTGEAAERGADGRLVLKEETGLVLVLLPGGTFSMGAQSRDPAGPNHDPQAVGDEGPVHEVTLSPFFLSKYEMTQGQWLRFVGRNPSIYGPETYSANWNRSGRKGDLLHPVERVDWNQCMEACERLGLVLPSEAQWEYAARGGTTNVWWTGSEKESLGRSTAANLADSWAKGHGGSNWTAFEEWLDDGYTVHAPIGTYAPNAFGLHEVHGNLFEWCRDGYQSGFYARPPERDPLADPGGSPGRVMRGGAFSDAATRARSADRNISAPEAAGVSLGLRPARVVTGHFAASPLPSSGRGSLRMGAPPERPCGAGR